mmetsp:Transcript_133779/g.266930  ORF Transcript_133779/g.266930 Transcript_133779/m.266930 type:complete len:407 (+) Transcript_133779:47-1267(+)
MELLEGFTQIPTWVIGAIVCLFGSTLTAFGLVLQKQSHSIDELSGRGARRYYLQGWWLLGFGTFLSAQIINMVAMAMTPQVVLSCLGSWTLACNAIFTRLILKESLSRSRTAAIVGLVIATALVISTAPRPSADHLATNIDRLTDRFVSPEFETLTAFLLGLVLVARVLAAHPEDDLCAVASGALTKARDGRQGLEAALLAPVPQPHKVLVCVPLAWATMAAIGAGYTALLFKCVAEILAAPLIQPGVPVPWFFRWEPYAIVGVALLCAPTELHCLNLALQRGEAGLVVPAYLTLGMLAQMATGAVFFQEFRDFSSRAHTAAFCCSVLLTLMLVRFMAQSTEEAEMQPVTKLNEPHDPQWLNDNQTLHDRQVSVAGFGGAIECLEGNQSPRKCRCLRLSWPDKVLP